LTGYDPACRTDGEEAVKAIGFELMARPHTFRDPIHGDIHVTALETAIIDTLPFQRLRRVRQLGTTYLVYPGALHTRFDHALGALAAAEKIMTAVNRNAERWGGLTIPVEARTLIRVCALLHDIGHVPFGHTLEDETKVLSIRHDSRPAVEQLINEIFDSVASINGDNIDIQGWNASKFIEEVVNTITASDDPNRQGGGCIPVDKLEYPFAYDIVGNTVCADLLDYLRRDNYFCGLTGDYDDRLLDYLYIDQASKRLVLSLTKGNELYVRSDVLSELVRLIHERFRLSESVYYHHTKCYTSAMISTAVQAAFWGLPAENMRRELLQYGDDELVTWLERHHDEVAGRLGRALRERRVYKPVYTISQPYYWRNSRWANNAEDWNNNPRKRWEFERLLESRNDLPPGTIVVYCPDPAMQLKIVKIRVSIGQAIAPLNEVLAPTPHSGAGREIQDRLGARIDSFLQIIHAHKSLWKLHVLVDPQVLAQRPRLAEEIVRDCVDELGMQNERGIGAHPDVWSLRAIERYEATANAGLTAKQSGQVREALEEKVAPTHARPRAWQGDDMDQYPFPRVTKEYIERVLKELPPEEPRLL
jgi:HD superfamily phosphohydrolase